MNVIDKLKSGELEITDGNIIAGHLNDHFSAVGKNYASKIPTPNRSTHDYSQSIPREEKSLFMYPTTTSEIS